jgi:phosphocarrier protein
MRFDADIWLIANDRAVDMKSIMGVMSLGIYKAATFKVKTSGSDEEKALEAITELLVRDNLGVIYE